MKLQVGALMLLDSIKPFPQFINAANDEKMVSNIQIKRKSLAFLVWTRVKSHIKLLYANSNNCNREETTI